MKLTPSRISKWKTKQGLQIVWFNQTSVVWVLKFFLLCNNHFVCLNNEPDIPLFIQTKTSAMIVFCCFNFLNTTKVPITLNIDLIPWHTQLFVCAENVTSWFKSWVFPFTFQAYILPHTLNCMCNRLSKFHIWILEQI